MFVCVIRLMRSVRPPSCLSLSKQRTRTSLREVGMTITDLTIRDIKARAVVAPLKHTVRTAVVSISSAPLVLIDVLTEQGVAGHSYIFAYTVAALVPLARLVDEIGAELKGKSIAPVVRMREFDRRFRLVGWQGVLALTWLSGMRLRERSTCQS